MPSSRSCPPSVTVHSSSVRHLSPFLLDKLTTARSRCTRRATEGQLARAHCLPTVSIRPGITQRGTTHHAGRCSPYLPVRCAINRGRYIFGTRGIRWARLIVEREPADLAIQEVPVGAYGQCSSVRVWRRKVNFDDLFCVPC